MIHFKHSKDARLFSALHPIIIMIFSDLWVYAYEKHDIDLTVTQTISTAEEDKFLNRKSSSHRDSRAIDIRVKNLKKEIILDIVSYINSKAIYEKYKYLSFSGNKRLAFYHGEGLNAHIHLAINSKYTIK